MKIASEFSEEELLHIKSALFEYVIKIMDWEPEEEYYGVLKLYDEIVTLTGEQNNG